MNSKYKRPSRTVEKARRSLLWDLKINLIGVVALVSALTGGLVYYFLDKQTQEEFQTNLQDYSRYLQSTLELPLWDKEDELVQAICQAFSTHGDLALLVVRSDEGQVLCNVHHGHLQTANATPLPIFHKAQNVGELELSLDSDYYQQRSGQFLLHSLITTIAVMMAVAGLLRLLLGQLLSKPLDSLTSHIGELAEGSYQVDIPPDERREFAFILHKFNEMAERIAAREQALRESEQRYRALFEQAAVGVAQVDALSGRFLQVNRRYCEICGRSEEEMLATTFSSITHPDDVGDCTDSLNRLIDGQTREYIVEKRYIRPDGSSVWVDLTASALWPPGQEPSTFVAVAQDVTEGLKAKEDLLHLNLELEQRVRQETQKNREKDLLLIQQARLAAMGEMVHNIAHQWRQPLNTLSCVLGNIQDEFDFGEMTAESLREGVGKCHRLLQRMSATVDDFRNFFSPDKETRQFDLGKAAEEAVFIIGDAIKNNDIELDCDLEKDVYGEGYPNQLAQVILNLLVNAKDVLIDRKIASGRIVLKLRSAGGMAILSVEDNAGGIPDEVLPKVFDPYFTTKDQGSGIGLYMAKMIVERNMKGRIIAANNTQGAILTITVPLSTPRQVS